MHESTLTSRQRRYLKGLAHGGKVPLCHVGREGLSDGQLKSLNAALSDHELIKVQFVDKENIDRRAYAVEVADAVRAQLVQVIGFKAVLYRSNPEQPAIRLPTA